jgi:serine/threonine protein kinase
MARGKTVLWEPIKIPGLKYVRKLGEGGFATTHLFADQTGQYGQYVAVKVPLDKEREEALILGDIVALCSLREVPGIVKILDIKRINDRYLLLMEYVDGVLLRELMDIGESAGVIAVERALSYALQIARGLAAAHERQLVHRDIKPENIIIERSTGVAKILDFGIASGLGKRGSFKTVVGRYTPKYTPGEVIFEGKGDHRVDIYSLGVTLYEMLTGSFPCSEEKENYINELHLLREGKVVPPRERNPKIPLYVEQAILKAISYSPEERFQSMNELIMVLEPPQELEIARRNALGGAVRRAETVLRSLIERSPVDLRGHLALAKLLSRCCRFEEARDMIGHSLQNDPEVDELHLQMAMILVELGQKEKALEHLRRVESLTADEKTIRRIKMLRLRLQQ